MFAFASNLEQGMCVSIDGFPFVVVSATPVKYGKGALFIQADLRDVASGTVRRIELNPTQRLLKANLNIKQMRYTRTVGDAHIFRDVASGEKVAIPENLLHDDMRLLEAGSIWRFVYLDGNLCTVLSPIEQFG